MNENIKESIAEALADELNAVSFYAWIANNIDDPVLKSIVMSIVGDEFGHARMWAIMLALDE